MTSRDTGGKVKGNTNSRSEKEMTSRGKGGKVKERSLDPPRREEWLLVSFKTEKNMIVLTISF